jgi:hypothetical protein
MTDQEFSQIVAQITQQHIMGGMPGGYGNYHGYGMPQNPATAGLGPQGIGGSFLGGIAGDWIGGLFGDTGATIGGIAGGLLGTILPFGANPGLAIAGTEPGGGNGHTGTKPLLIPYDTVDPATRAKIDLTRAATKGLIDQLVKWLDKNQQNGDQIGEIVQLTTRAAELFQANDLQRASTQAQWAYFALERARARATGLPALFS